MPPLNRRRSRERDNTRSKAYHNALFQENRLTDLTPYNTKCLYHYTGVDALREILTKSTLRLTDYRFFNDSTESEHAYQLLENCIEERNKIENKLPIEEWTLKEIEKRIPELKAKRKYVICFSTKPDDLNQWRSYASPGAGFCMGFETRDLYNLAENFNGLLGKCIYDEKEQRSLIFQIINSVVDGLDSYFPYFGPEDINEDLAVSTATSFVHGFSKIAPMFKNSAFKEEAEVRFVLEKTAESKLGFRSGTHTIVPYQEISLKIQDGVIFPSQVCIKSSREPHLAKIGLEEFLVQHKISSDIVIDSNIPYRETV